MAYGSGAPLWGKKGESLTSQHDGQNAQLNNRHQTGAPYQGPNAGTYQPPPVSGTYAEQQTQVMEDTMRTQYQAEGTAQTVLSQMTTQRYQLEGAHGNVHEMREATERAKRELMDLRVKTQAKKRKLKLIVAALGFTDAFLFFRLLYCGGSFFCRRW